MKGSDIHTAFVSEVYHIYAVILSFGTHRPRSYIHARVAWPWAFHCSAAFSIPVHGFCLISRNALSVRVTESESSLSHAVALNGSASEQFHSSDVIAP
jgi:hypothetical protein